MGTTTKVTALAASIFAVNCALAGLSYADSAMDEVPEIMGDINAAMALLVVIQGGLIVLLARIVIRQHRKNMQPETPPSVLDTFAEEIDSLAGSGKAAKQIMGAVLEIKEAIAPVLEEYHMRKAQGKEGDLPPL